MDPRFQTSCFERGVAYLYHLRSLAPAPDLIDFVDPSASRNQVCGWIGSHIDAVNAQLLVLLQSCQDCFHPWHCPPVQIFAAPFAQHFGIDGVCNLQSQPISILVDVGRVYPPDWVALVVHEYAHAHLGVPGHHAEFVHTLSHLCLALDLPAPLGFFPLDSRWCSFPPYRSNPLPLHFWSGSPNPSPFD